MENRSIVRLDVNRFGVFRFSAAHRDSMGAPRSTRDELARRFLERLLGRFLEREVPLHSRGGLKNRWQWIALATLSVFTATALTGCDRSPATSADSLEQGGASPNASILPAPFSSGPQALTDPPGSPGAGATATTRPEVSNRYGLRDAAGPPAPLRTDQAVDPDLLPVRELPGVTLRAEWRYPDVPPAPRTPEANGPALDALRKDGQPTWTIELSAIGRMRTIFTSRGFPVDPGAELRARVDRYGHLLFFPELESYRVLPPGAVRTLLDERRIDAVPLVRAPSVVATEAGRRLGYAIRRWDLPARAGRLVLEQARIAASGDGGILLCRLLVELVAIDPDGAPCASDEVPLHGQFFWPSGSSATFDVTAVSEHPELPAAQLLCPPGSASFTSAGLPISSTGLAREELASLRLRPIDTAPPGPFAPAKGLLAINGSDLMHGLIIDGIPAAWIPPSQEQLLDSLLRGRYVVQWRSFLADSVDPPKTLDLPARFGFKLPPEPPPRDHEPKQR